MTRPHDADRVVVQGDGGENKAEETHDDGFVHRETNKIFLLRGTVVFILLAAATGIVSVVAFVTSRSQKSEMNLQFDGVSGYLRGTRGFLDIRAQSLTTRHRSIHCNC